MDQNRHSVPVQIFVVLAVVLLVGITGWYTFHQKGESPPAGDEAGRSGKPVEFVGVSFWEPEESTPTPSPGGEFSGADHLAAEALVAEASAASATGELGTLSGGGGVKDATGQAVTAAIASATGSDVTGSIALPGVNTTPLQPPESTPQSDISPREPAETAEAGPTPTGSPFGSISGRVIGRITSNPVAGVNVICSLGGTAVGTVVSDDRGVFHFGGLTEGLYRVEALDHQASADVEVVAGQTSDVVLSVDDRGSISGRVVTSQGWPVRGALVRLLQSVRSSFGEIEKASVRSGDGGSFFLLAVPVGVPVSLRAEHDDYAPATRGPFLVYSDSPLEGVELVLTPGGVIEGRVTNIEGVPLPSARLEARVMGQWGRTHEPSSQGGVARTGEDGTYQIRNLPPGEWEVRASATGYAFERKRCTLAGANDTVTVDFALSPGEAVLGMVGDSRGIPLSGARVCLVGGLFSEERETSSDGTFEFESVPEGAYNIAAERAGYSPAWRSINTRDTHEVILTLEDLATLFVRVVATGDKPVESYTLALSRRNFPGGLLSAPLETQMDVTSPNGLYFTNVGAGSYKLVVNAKGYRPTQRDISLEPGPAQDPILIQLKGGLVLEGSVASAQNGAPVQGAEVSWFYGHIPGVDDGFFIPDPGLLTNPAGTVISEPGGWYVLDGLPPANITLLCRASGFCTWISPPISMGYEDGTLNIDLQPGVRVTGSVYYLGHPFPDASVELQPANALREVPPEGRPTTDAQGQFLIESVCPGSYRLFVSRWYNLSLLSRGFRVDVPVEDTRFDIQFPGGELSVVLTDAVSGAQVKNGIVRLHYVEIQQEIGGVRLEIPETLTLKETDGAGAFTFVALPSGEYRVVTQVQGYATIESLVSLAPDEHRVETLSISPSVSQ